MMGQGWPNLMFGFGHGLWLSCFRIEKRSCSTGLLHEVGLEKPVMRCRLILRRLAIPQS